MFTRRLLVAALAVSCSVAWVSVTGSTDAHAAPPRTNAQGPHTASEYGDAGMARHKAKDWAGAVAMWSKAYSLDPKPQYLWALARDEHRASMWEAAERHYLAFIALKEVPPELRDKMASLRAKAAQYLVEISKAKAARDEAATPKPAAHKPATPKPTGQKPATPKPAAQKPTRDHASLGALAHSSSQPGHPGHTGLAPGLTSQADVDSGGNTAGWVILGGGVALVAGGVGATVAASAATDDMQKYSAPPTQALVDPYRSKYGDAKDTRSTALTASYVLYGLGAAGAVAGLVMVLTGGSSHAAKPSEGDTADGDTASTLGGASVRPVFLPSGAGVAATLSF